LIQRHKLTGTIFAYILSAKKQGLINSPHELVHSGTLEYYTDCVMKIEEPVELQAMCRIHGFIYQFKLSTKGGYHEI